MTLKEFFLQTEPGMEFSDSVYDKAIDTLTEEDLLTEVTFNNESMYLFEVLPTMLSLQEITDEPSIKSKQAIEENIDEDEYQLFEVLKVLCGPKVIELALEKNISLERLAALFWGNPSTETVDYSKLKNYLARNNKLDNLFNYPEIYYETPELFEMAYNQNPNVVIEYMKKPRNLLPIARNESWTEKFPELVKILPSSGIYFYHDYSYYCYYEKKLDKAFERAFESMEKKNISLDDIFSKEEIKERTDWFYYSAFLNKTIKEQPQYLEYCPFSAINKSMGPKLVETIKQNPDCINFVLKIIYKEAKGNFKYFKTFINEKFAEIDSDKITNFEKVIRRLEYSNSSDLQRVKYEILDEILNADNPIESLDLIENIFLKNNLPPVGKAYSVFATLHPNEEGFNYDTSSTVSPVLKESTSRSRQIIIFADLIKASFGSNNRGVKEYIENIEEGNKVFVEIYEKNKTIESLTNQEKEILKIYLEHLQTLYNNSQMGKMRPYRLMNNLNQDTTNLMILFSPNGELDYELPDRIVRMFCHFAGIDTLEEAKGYCKEFVEKAHKRNIARSQKEDAFILEKGDYLKGLGDITYISDILQNGSVAKEFLGASADSDRTPLDTDLSKLDKTYGTMTQVASSIAATDYGPIWLVLKNDDRFQVTRQSSIFDEVITDGKNPSKLEVFYTGAQGGTHYGIRTGFASSEIDYLITDEYRKQLSFEVARNGFYIPIVNKKGKLIFTPEEYYNLRAKMQGLKYYGESNYTFANDEVLISPEVEAIKQQLEGNNEETTRKRETINKVISKVLSEYGLEVKYELDGDLTAGKVDLFDTGSTGRGTNKPKDGDFDFIMRLDSEIMSKPEKLETIKQSLLKAFGKEGSNSGDFRLKAVQVEDLEEPVDIDITFIQKTDKLHYSTDAALKDRLETLRQKDPERYEYVVANIILAKKVLKEGKCYKPYRSDQTQGGLGGVGVENWILQNGGSFYQAATTFLEAAAQKDFKSFKEVYQIWDFGENHMADRKGKYPHDEFVYDNMSEDGYGRMVSTLKEYVKSVKITRNQSEKLAEELVEGMIEGTVDSEGHAIAQTESYESSISKHGNSNITTFIFLLLSLLITFISIYIFIK